MNNEALRSILFDRLRQTPPADCSIVPGSTPVFAFGRFHQAKVATISLNPSYHEFDLVRGQRRFHTLESLGVSGYDDFTEKHLDQIADYCETYFERGITYKQYFGQLQAFIQQFIPTASYAEGTACHLDISQWATETVWGKLTEPQRRRIVSTQDIELIRSIIQHGQHEILLLNGKTAAENILGGFFKLRYDQETITTVPSRLIGYYAEFDHLLGVPLGRTVKCLGWNVTVHHGVRKEHRPLLIDWMKKHL